jgi:hypothetical protein
MPGNGNGNGGEHGPEAEQSVDDALVVLVATIGASSPAANSSSSTR